jgi:uroporphyrinogen-III decarboxylase
MRTADWRRLMKAAHGEHLSAPPVALIVDSPWIPQFLGISTVDYIAIPEVWFKANMTVMNEFPEAIFLPGFWVEPGMAAEPSGYGCRVTFSADQPPSIRPIAEDIADLEALVPANPRKDGLMPLVLAQYRNVLPMVRAAGMDIKIAAARGPLALAAHLLGLTAFLVGLKTEPEKTHRLLRTTTRTVKEWIEAQAEVLPGIGGILLLDDVMGFLSREDYLEFAHPCFKEIFAASDGLKILHNDSGSPVCYEFLGDLGVNVFNFTHLQGIASARARVGESVCLMGNVPPLDVLAKGSVQQTAKSARACVAENDGHPAFLLSAGGGVSPGTPGENIRALISAATGGQPTGKDRV